jgi:LysM repeat protein
MDMLNILKNMDAAAKGEKPSAGTADVNDMKTILESIQSVQECGMDMPAPAPQPEEKVSMNVTLNARGDAVEELIRLIGGKDDSHAKPDSDNLPMKLPMPTPAPKDSHDDMAKLMAIASAEHGESVDEEWENAPDEEYSDHEYMIKDLSGGINRQKPKGSERAKDPAVTTEQEDLIAELRAQLRSELDQKLGEAPEERGVQSNGRLVNFNIDKSKPKNVFVGPKGEEKIIYATPEELTKAQAGDLKGWKPKAAAQPAQSNAELDADSADNAAPAAAPAAAPQSNAELDADSADNAAPAAAAAPAAPAAKAGGEYTVVAGDNLTKIAKANNTTVDELVKLNGIKDANKIQIGQKIKLPGGENISSIEEPGIVDKAQAAVGGAVDAAQDAIGAGSDTAVGKGIDAVQGAVGSAVDKGQEVASDVADAAGEAWDAVSDTAVDAWNGLKSLFGGDSSEAGKEVAQAATPDDALKTAKEKLAAIQAEVDKLEAAKKQGG